MLNVRYSTRFQRDFKLCQKRQLNMELLYGVIESLRAMEPLPMKNRDHSLAGDHSGYRECHIQPDWLLIYQTDADGLMLVRMGTHADLFGK